MRSTSTESHPSGWNIQRLSDLLEEVDVRAAELNGKEPSHLEVLSLTKRFGLVPQSERFDKRVATENVDKYKVVRPGWIVYNRFLDFILRSPQAIEAYEKRSAGAVNRRRSIKREDFLTIEVECPTLEEQRRIAKILKLVRTGIERQQKLLDLCAELKVAALHKLIHAGLRGEEQQETEIGAIPNSWTAKSMGQCCEIIGSSLSYTDFDKLSYSDDPNAVMCMAIKVSDMNLVGNEVTLVRANVMRRLPRALAEKKLIPPRSLVFPKRGAAIATNKKRLTIMWTVLDPNLIAVHPQDGLDADFVYHWAQTFDLRKITSPGPTPQLNKKDLVPIRLPVPGTVEEQREIVSVMNAIDAKAEVHRRRQRSLTSLFRTLLNKVAAGGIDTTNADLSVLDPVVLN